MSLVIPTVSAALSPDWASDLNASLTILDSHSHVSGSGVQITPAAININSDLSWNNAYNAIGLRSLRLFPSGSALSAASDLGCLYVAGVDLYYNDSNGNQIRITQSSSVAGSAGTITGLPSGSASAAFQSASGTFQFQQATSTAANVDVGTVVVRYPGSYPTPSGNYIALEAPTSLASGYALTLPALPGQTNVMTLTAAGVIASVTFDSVGSTMTSTGANAVAATRTRATGASTEGIGGVPVSSSSSSFGMASTIPAVVTGVNITLTTSGRPVMVMCQPDGTAPGLFSCDNLVNPPEIDVYLYRDTTNIAFFRFGLQSTTQYIIFPPSAVQFVDVVAAGTYTYSLKVALSVSGGTVFVTNVKMVAFEL